MRRRSSSGRARSTGARIANLLPGVWSARMPLKLRNRAVETLLTAWVEPWSAFARALGLADERPALEQAWRSLLCNQAHDSICGCSIDPVHERMVARYDDAEGLGRATLQRVLERLAGANVTRDTPWQSEQTVAVFNASADAAHRRRAGSPRRLPAVAGQPHALRHASARDAVVHGRHRRRPARAPRTQHRSDAGAVPARRRRARRRVRRGRRSRARLPPVRGGAGRTVDRTPSTTAARSRRATSASLPATTGRFRSRSAPRRSPASSPSRTRSTAAIPTTVIPTRSATVQRAVR